LSTIAAATRRLSLAFLVLLAGCGGTREEAYERPAARAAALDLDHAWISVAEVASVRTMLEQGGFRLTGDRILFENGFVEVRTGQAAGASPFGIGFRRTAATPASVPFGAAGGGQLPLALTTATIDVAANRAAIEAGGPAAEPFLHPNGTRRLTGVRVTAPTRAALPPAATLVNLSGAAELRVGTEWVMEIELDHGTQNQELDLRPRLPLVLRL
jgi:hypothetical protein